MNNLDICNNQSNNVLQVHCENDSVPSIKNYLKNKKINTKIVNDILIVASASGKVKIVKWIISMYGDKFGLKYEIAFKNAAKNSHNNIVNYLLKIIQEIYCDFDDLFSFCCSNNMIDSARNIYKFGYVVAKRLFNDKTKKIKKYGVINNNDLLLYLTNLLKQEKLNEHFLSVCLQGDLNKIKQYYARNKKDILFQYKMHDAFATLCNAHNNDGVKWILSLYLPSCPALFAGLVDMCKNNDTQMVNYINDVLNNNNMITNNAINSFFGILIETGDYHIVMKLYELGYKIKNNCMLVQCILDLGGIDDEIHCKYFRILYLKHVHKFELSLGDKVNFFMYCCELVCVKNLIWVHNRVKLFNSPDKLYLKFMEISCMAFNIYAAEWLANLYDEYEVKIIDLGYDDNENDEDDDNINICIIYVKLSEEKILYKKISKNKLSDTSKFKLLGIDKLIKNTNEDISCLICLEKPIDLIKLKCNHYSCITCLCTWFLNQENDHKQECSYCKSPIVWNDCKMITCDEDSILNDVYESLKITNEQTNEITQQYDNIIKEFVKK